MHHRALSAPHLSGLELALNLFRQLLKEQITWPYVAVRILDCYVDSIATSY
jgi:hypothetical protein